MAEDWLRTFHIVFVFVFVTVTVTVIALHQLIWKPSGISDAIDQASG